MIVIFLSILSQTLFINYAKEFIFALVLDIFINDWVFRANKNESLISIEKNY